MQDAWAPYNTAQRGHPFALDAVLTIGIPGDIAGRRLAAVDVAPGAIQAGDHG
ncbi:hypothetical protein L5I01_04350 [Gordonia sp. HY442]|nr:hypothetical protein [Gordonia zhenghanii]